MNDEINGQILALQERMRAGELTAEEYMIAVARLTDPEKAAEMEADLLLKTLPDYSFEDDDDAVDLKDTIEPTQSTSMATIIILVIVIAIFAVASFTIALAWVLIRSSMG